MEQWKKIRGCPNYEVSNHGRVKSKYRILKQTINRDGYLYVGMSINKKSKTFKVHLLVLENFICSRPENKCANHIDGNKLNNHIDNLEWVTWSENALHAWRNGLNKGGTKLNPIDVYFIRFCVWNKVFKQVELAKMFNVIPPTIGDIVHYRNWKHL